MNQRITAPIKYPGAKWSYAEWICSYLPPHRFYLEPFFGSGAVFFTKRPAVYETVNDLDGQVVNFFRVCREAPEDLARLVVLTPYSRREFQMVQEAAAGQELPLTDDPVENARRFLVRCSQGHGSRLSQRCGWKNTKHSSGPVNSHVWNKLPQLIAEVAKRLKHTQIECTDGVRLIGDCNAPDCMVYADPPYPALTGRRPMYRREMLDEEAHVSLFEALLDHRGPVVLSGYDTAVRPVPERMA